MRGLDPQAIVDFLGLLTLDNGCRWVVEPFQRDIIDELCAGTTETWFETPEGNAKSTLGAGLALAHALFVPRARVLLAAASRDQAGEATFGQAQGLVAASEDVLGDVFTVQPGHRRVLVRDMGSRIQVFSASKSTGQGVIPTFVLVDEGHVLPDFGLVRVWRGKLRKRDGQMLLKSNAGEPGGVYETIKAKAVARCASVERVGMHEVARGEHFTLHRWALEEGQDVEDLDLVKAANPLSTLTREKLSDALHSESFDRPHWTRMVCGVPERGEMAAINEREWKALTRSLIPKGAPVVAGLDLAFTHDTTALVALWMPEISRRVVGRPTILVPPRDGTSLPVERVQDAFRQLNARNPIEFVAMDPSAGGKVIEQWITGELGCPVIEVPPVNGAQTQVYNAWMEAVRQGWIEHPHDELLDAHVLNAVAKPVSHDRFRFDRPVSSRAAKFQDQRVIDALIAASGAHWVKLGQMLAVPERKGLSNLWPGAAAPPRRPLAQTGARSNLF